jgi:hypothetical protein
MEFVPEQESRFPGQQPHGPDMTGRDENLTEPKAHFSSRQKDYPKNNDSTGIALIPGQSLFSGIIAPGRGRNVSVTWEKSGEWGGRSQHFSLTSSS